MDCLEVDITEPLNKTEWTNLCKVIEETQGLGWFQILPVGQKASQPYQFNVLHVIPSDKIPVQSIPLDVYIANQVAYYRRKERQPPQVEVSMMPAEKT